MIFKITQNEVTGWWTSIQDGNLGTLTTAPSFRELMDTIRSYYLYDQLEGVCHWKVKQERSPD